MSFTKPSTAVKWAVSSMTGAPTLSGTAGSLIAVLDAFLVTGFGTKAVDSAQVTDGICRLSFTGTSAALEHTVISVAGVTGDGAVLNGEQRVSAVSSTYLEFACDLPDGPLTGTITFKIAPLGWEKVFSKTNVAVYKPTDAAAAPFYLRVDDSGSLHARITVYETMTTVDSGFNVAPNSATVSGGYFWWKSSAANANGVQYALIGDSRALIFSPMPTAGVGVTASAAFVPFFAGEFCSARSGDAYGVMVTGALANTPNAHGSLFAYLTTASYASILRKSYAIGGAIPAARCVLGVSSGVSGDASMPLGPINPSVDSTLRVGRVLIADGDSMSSFGVRGGVPGVVTCLNTGALSTFGGGFSITKGMGDFQGRMLMTLAVGVDHTTPSGVGLVDITGPWR